VSTLVREIVNPLAGTAANQAVLKVSASLIVTRLKDQLSQLNLLNKENELVIVNFAHRYALLPILNEHRNVKAISDLPHLCPPSLVLAIEEITGPILDETVESLAQSPFPISLNDVPLEGTVGFVAFWGTFHDLVKRLAVNEEPATRIEKLLLDPELDKTLSEGLRDRFISTGERIALVSCSRCNTADR
jgi:hypothetical protein